MFVVVQPCVDRGELKIGCGSASPDAATLAQSLMQHLFSGITWMSADCIRDTEHIEQSTKEIEKVPDFGKAQHRTESSQNRIGPV